MGEIKAWGIISHTGKIHLDKVMKSKGEAWGLLADEAFDWPQYKSRLVKPTIASLKKDGWTCVRVTVKWSDQSQDKP